MEEKQQIPDKLKSTMNLHIVNDLILCVSLFFFPEHFIQFSGWKNFDPFALRLIAAGLSAVAIELYLKRNSSLETYTSLFNVKLFTLGLAATGAAITMFNNVYHPTTAEWILLGGTGIPFIQMGYWKIKLNKLPQD